MFGPQPDSFLEVLAVAGVRVPEGTTATEGRSVNGADGFDDAFRFTKNGARLAKDGTGLKRSTYVPPQRPALVGSRRDRRRRRRQKRRLRRVYRAHRSERRWVARVKRTALILFLVISSLLCVYAFFLSR